MTEQHTPAVTEEMLDAYVRGYTASISSHFDIRAARRAGIEAALATAPQAPVKADDYCTFSYTDDAEKLKQLLTGRDQFIVEQGLWLKFVGSLPYRSAPVEAALSAPEADFEAWAAKWHRTVETMCVMLGISGNGSPEEILASLQDRLSSTPEAREAAQAELDRLAFLNAHVNFELSWGEIDGWPDDCQWRVHRRNGGRNDTEWKLLGYGPTVEQAIDAARAALNGKEG